MKLRKRYQNIVERIFYCVVDEQVAGMLLHIKYILAWSLQHIGSPKALLWHFLELKMTELFITVQIERHQDKMRCLNHILIRYWKQKYLYYLSRCTFYYRGSFEKGRRI